MCKLSRRKADIVIPLDQRPYRGLLRRHIKRPTVPFLVQPSASDDYRHLEEREREDVPNNVNIQYLILHQQGGLQPTRRRNR